jgi:hypothetical protein
LVGFNNRILAANLSMQGNLVNREKYVVGAGVQAPYGS